MREGILGLPRPFVEEGEIPLVVIIEFDPKILKGEIKQYDKKIVREAEKRDIVMGNRGINVNKNNSLLAINLTKTNSDFSELQEIREFASGLPGFRKMVVSTVEPEQIMRLNR